MWKKNFYLKGYGDEREKCGFLPGGEIRTTFWDLYAERMIVEKIPFKGWKLAYTHSISVKKKFYLKKNGDEREKWGGMRIFIRGWNPHHVLGPVRRTDDRRKK